ncbi:hypothetical protein PFISCL1PPCAC_29172, partial [Pristionchus fissidentatus]
RNKRNRYDYWNIILSGSHDPLKYWLTIACFWAGVNVFTSSLLTFTESRVVMNLSLSAASGSVFTSSEATQKHLIFSSTLKWPAAAVVKETRETASKRA